MSDCHVRQTKLSNGHGRRTKKPTTIKLAHGRSRLFGIAFVALHIVVAIPAVLYIAYPSEHDDIVTIIKEYGFNPLIPPNQLRGPGALYQVEGNSYTKVCGVDPTLLVGKLQKSPTHDHVRSRFETGKFSLGGSYVEGLNAKLNGARITTIEYTMKDVAISEIAMDDLLEIQDNLLREKRCDDTVHRLLKANRQICAGYAALSATTSYKVRYDSKFEASEQNKMTVVNLVQKVIEDSAGSTIHIQSADELVGENLFYGIQLSKLCITPDTAADPSVRPDLPAPEKVSQLGGGT
jgi:hypothetical protein